MKEMSNAASAKSFVGFIERRDYASRLDFSKECALAGIEGMTAVSSITVKRDSARPSRFCRSRLSGIVREEADYGIEGRSSSRC